MVDFWREAKGLTSIGDAIRELESLSAPSIAPQPPTSYRAAEEFIYPEGFRGPTEIECYDLCLLRGIPARAFSLAGLLGCLVVGPDPVRNQSLWWITDTAKRGLEARTFDGDPVRVSGKKCYAYPGSSKRWLYGLSTTNKAYDSLDRVLIVEGGPDFFAGLALAIESDINFRVAAMLGAGANISDEALTLLEHRSVLIIPHSDSSGAAGIERWKTKIKPVARDVTVQTLFKKDLNEEFLEYGMDACLQLLKGFNR